MNKIDINLDATGLGHSACNLEFNLACIEGYKTLMNCNAIYGVALHKFTEVMYKTGGDFRESVRAGLASFNRPKLEVPERQAWLGDPKHFQVSCYNLWTQQVESDTDFSLLTIPAKCYWCDGTGNGPIPIPCPKCEGTGVTIGPAVEVTFRILFYEDEFVRIWLCGTIDKIGQIKGGCYAIGDWKTTSQWDKEKFLSFFQMHRQLRIYTLALKKMAILEPDSILGKFGSKNFTSFIDGIFLKAQANDNEYKRQHLEPFSAKSMAEFEATLQDYCTKLSYNVQHNRWTKEGLLNGSCRKGWGKCSFWNVCRTDDRIAKVLLERDFTRVQYNPLNFAGEGVEE